MMMAVVIVSIVMNLVHRLVLMVLPAVIMFALTVMEKTYPIAMTQIVLYVVLTMNFLVWNVRKDTI
jgi:hypothetical protein